MNPIEFSTKIALETGKVLMEHYQPSGVKSQLKSDNTIITEADQIANQHLQQRITQVYPDDGILSEEGSTIFPENKTTVWIIDPLDGTTNFSLGLHYWGVSIARLVNGYPDIGVLYFPIIDELYTSAKGSGAHLNGTILKMKEYKNRQPANFFSCCSRGIQYYNISIRYKTRIFGSAAYGLVSVARGSSILAFEATPKVWDFAASWCIIQEAGGVINRLRGEDPFPLVPGKDYGKKSYPLIAAANQDFQSEGCYNIRKRV